MNDTTAATDAARAPVVEGAGIAPPRAAPSQQKALQGSLRGSGLLLAGRLVAIALNFAVQVLTVRYLARTEYGSFSFALSAVALATNFNLFGLARAMSRLAPLYAERGLIGELRGALVVSFSWLALIGAALVALTAALWQVRPTALGGDPLSAELLVLLVVLTPLSAFDAVLEVLCAGFAGARTVAFRRHLLTPALRLAAILGVIALGRGVHALSVAYVVAGVIGVGSYTVLLRRALAARGLTRATPRRFPVRAVLGLGSSLLVVDLMGVTILHFPSVVVEAMHGPAEVAGLRAVVPLATLGLVILNSLKLLYVPLATRTFERAGKAGVSEVHWACARWIALLTFPIFAVSAFLSPQLVPLLFGERYADAAPLATVMAFGFYAQAILEVHTLTLQALGRSKELVLAAAIALGLAVVSTVLLVPRFGAMGAAVATMVSLVGHNSATLVIALRCGALERPHRADLGPVMWLAGGTLLPLVVLPFLGERPAPAFALVAATVTVMFLGTRRWMDLLQTFPELRKVPVLGRLLR